MSKTQHACNSHFVQYPSWLCCSAWGQLWQAGNFLGSEGLGYGRCS